MSGLLIDPMVSFDLIDREEANAALSAWAHKHGELHRPIFKDPIDYGVRERGDLVAVITTDTLIRPTQGFNRSQACEISRICADRAGLCHTALRLWKQFAFPAISRAWGIRWVISYQDATRHAGELYRRNSFALIGYSSGGGDPRAAQGTVNVRRRLIWAWTDDKPALDARRKLAREDRPHWPEWAGGQNKPRKEAA